MESCEECGYAYDSRARGELADTIRSFAPRYRAILARDEAMLRAHPVEGTWSVLEYACHFRDVLRVQRERMERALREDEPTFASMRREERVTEERYNEQAPKQVAFELAESAGALADDLDRLDQKAWQRTGIYNYPTKEARTVEWIARHTIHEGEHHLMDIERLLSLDG
jgi:hypothetical protein